MSDTHGMHRGEPLDEVDMIIHCGDASNHENPYFNENEFLSFWRWWLLYPARYKIFVPGNHDTFLESGLSRELRGGLDPNYWILIDETVVINGVRIFGSPYTPRFGSWSFMAKRDKLHKHWELIEPNTNIVITHGPPKYILDLNERLEPCGCRALARVIREIAPQYHFFGHVHGNKTFENNGILEREGIKYVNCSQVIDGMISHGLRHFGKILTI